MKILHLAVNKQAFDVMITGEKKPEFRRPSRWIISRLFDENDVTRQYNAVKFTNGYGKNRPYFICKFEAVCKLFPMICRHTVEKYSNGLEVEVTTDDYVIRLGDIIETGNIN